MAGRGMNPGFNGGGAAAQRPQDGQGQGQNPQAEAPELSPEELEAARGREITTKAMTGILLLLLKWLRVSRKFPRALCLVLTQSGTFRAAD